MKSLYFIPPGKFIFPHPSLAPAHGLLCIGADLSPENLLLAYRFGIFPWYSEGDPILWWSPDPRLVLFPGEVKVSKSTRNIINRKIFRVSYNTNFASVIEACRFQKREGQPGTWITAEMEGAYLQLHKMGYAHSVEVWSESELAGGLYGIALGKVFYGESMFFRKSNASKIALISLARDLFLKGYRLIDCQQDTSHLRKLGARTISRNDFLSILKTNLLEVSDLSSWKT